jgi:hypothetical protein
LAKPFFFVSASLALVLGALFYFSQDLLDRSPPEFNEGLSRWRALGPTDYDMRVQLLCFCDSRPFVVEVRDRRAVRVHFESSGEGVLEGNDIAARALTMEDIFARVAKAYSKSSDSIKVTYDAKYGYPTYAEVDESKNAVDDEWTMTVHLSEVSHGA